MENQNLNQQPVEPQPEQQIPIQPEQPIITPEQPKTNWLLILIILGVALISYAGIAYWQNMWPFGEDIVVEVSPSPTPKSTPSETADWKTYRNDEYGFEMKYPNYWPNPEPFKLVGENMRTFIHDGEYSGGCCSGVRIEIIDKSIDNRQQDILRNLYSEEDVLSDKNILLGGVQAKEMVLVTHYGGDERVTLVSLGNKTIEFGRGVEDQLADQILSTFNVY